MIIVTFVANVLRDLRGEFVSSPAFVFVVRFVAMQNHYNLIYREEEREMIPLCNDAGVGLIPWSPLARGMLARICLISFRIACNAFGSSLTTGNVTGRGDCCAQPNKTEPNKQQISVAFKLSIVSSKV